MKNDHLRHLGLSDTFPKYCNIYSKRKTPAQSTLEEKVHGLSLQDVSLDTAAVSARLHFQGTVTYPLVPPVYHSSTYVLDKVEDFLGALQDVSKLVFVCFF